MSLCEFTYFCLGYGRFNRELCWLLRMVILVLIILFTGWLNLVAWAGQLRRRLIFSFKRLLSFLPRHSNIHLLALYTDRGGFSAIRSGPCVANCPSKIDILVISWLSQGCVCLSEYFVGLVDFKWIG